jgi:hypothetical protein
MENYQTPFDYKNARPGDKFMWLTIECVFHGLSCGKQVARIVAEHKYGLSFVRPDEAFKIEGAKETTKHVHYDYILAWANGEEIQWFDANLRKWFDVRNPVWEPDVKYRVKQEETVFETTMFMSPYPSLDNAYDKPNLRLGFDTNTNKLIYAEIIK